MRYFKPELLARCRSLDDDVAEAAAAEWDQAIARYNAKLAAIRPLFPEGFLHETQIIAMVLSADPEQDPNSLAIAGAAAALAISDIPFPYVLGGVRLGMREGKYIANPSYTEGRESKLNIVVAGTEDPVLRSGRL